MKDPNFESKYKKSYKMSESEGFFQILTHNNYEQTNGVQLEFFTKALSREYYSKPKN